MKILARIEIEKPSTPLLIGGYDGEACRRLQVSRQIRIEETLRVPSVRGVVRWWLRSLIVGALHYRGLRGRRLEFEMRRVESSIMGGSNPAQGEIRKASDVVFQFHEESHSCGWIGADEASQHDSLRLLFIKRRRPLSYLSDLSGTLLVGLRCMEVRSEHKLALAATALALALSGFGKRSRRGFGSVEFSFVRSELFEGLTSGGLTPRDLENLVRVSQSISREVAGGAASASPRSLPDLSAIHTDSFALLYSPRGGRDVHKTLQRMFTRSGLESVFGESPLRDSLSAWILGLPRSARDTGYFMPAGRGRRGSPFILSVHRTYSSLSIFPSMDWFRRIQWRGRYSRRSLDIDEDRIREAYSQAASTLFDWMEKMGFSPQWVVRPGWM
ncbi:MAG: hypothetical protein QI223_03985 [Candidatus Korarchaeota archaeon]|nr:hypothetical protein [Candidatus Korarchaeota archaeon]